MIPLTFYGRAWRKFHPIACRSFTNANKSAPRVVGSPTQLLVQLGRLASQEGLATRLNH